MKNFIKNIKNGTLNIVSKGETFANNTAIKLFTLKQNAKLTLVNNRGEGSVSTAITILISVVLGALLLAGLYYLMDEVVMKRLEIEVNEMFDYDGK